jgi:WD40 repeat protein
MAARLENAVLHERVKELTAKVKILVVENETLKAEVEIYREEAAVPNFSNLALGKSADSNDGMEVDGHDSDAFIRAGNGVYPSENEVTLSKLHDMSNPLCCALSYDDTMLASGGADATIRLSQWGSALNPSMTTESVVQSSFRIACAAPVICTSFSPVLRGVLAAGSMDGSLHLINYSTPTGAGIQATVQSVASDLKHRKYVRAVAWSPTKPILATCSADGSVQVFRVERTGMDLQDVQLTKMESLHLGSGVESLCFVGDKLVCYARGTPYLSFFDLGT